MGVQLNIKDPETVRLARELAGSTGRTVTQTIRAALEREAREREADIAERRARIDAIVAKVQATMPEEFRNISSKEAMDSLYDEDGLPH